MINAKKFREKYPDFVYKNHGRRADAYHTGFYILSKASLWRKTNGKLKPAYSYFNWLSGTKFTVIRKQIRIKTANCRECGKALIVEKSEDRREIGSIFYYKITEKDFRILDIGGLRALTKINVARYREDILQQGRVLSVSNGYG